MSRRALLDGTLSLSAQAASTLDQICRGWSHGRLQTIGAELLSLRSTLQRLRSLVLTLRNGAQPKEGATLEVARHRVDIVKLVELEVAKTVQALWRDHQVSVVAMTEPEPIEAIGDRRQLANVLLLALRYVAASLPPGALLMVRARRRLRSAVIEIQDDVGDPSSGWHDTTLALPQHPATLDRMTQNRPSLTDESTNRAEGDLTLVVGLIEAMNGTVSLTCTAGVGSCLTISLPKANPRRSKA